LRIARHLVLVLSLSSLGCGLMTAQEARVASSVLNGVACGVAAAQETPCTPQAVLDALARDQEAQRAKVDAVAPQAAAADPVLTKALVDQLAANARANEAIAKALVDLAARSAPLPPPRSPVAPPLPTKDQDPQGVVAP